MNCTTHIEIGEYMKIPKKYNKLIYEGYQELLAQGTPKTHIAQVLNERWGTKFPESSMRNRFEREELKAPESNDGAYQERLFRIATEELRIKEERNILNKQRGAVNGKVREYAEMGAVKQVIVDYLEMPVVQDGVIEVDEMEYTGDPSRHVEDVVYAFGDVHWGYINPGLYDTQRARDRMEGMTQWIIDDAKRNGYRTITLVDIGDQIEGSALRVSQLLNIAEGMTRQAKGYRDAFIAMVKLMSENLPNTHINIQQLHDDNHAQLRTFNTKRNEIPENMALLITSGVQSVVETAQEYGGLMNIHYRCGDELLSQHGDMVMLSTHGHRYGNSNVKAVELLRKAEQGVGQKVHVFLRGHFHRFHVEYSNVEQDIQTAILTVPSVVGDTDFSESLFVSAQPGFVKIKFNVLDSTVNAEFVRLN